MHKFTDILVHTLLHIPYKIKLTWQIFFFILQLHNLLAREIEFVYPSTILKSSTRSETEVGNIEAKNLIVTRGEFSFLFSIHSFHATLLCLTELSGCFGIHDEAQ